MLVKEEDMGAKEEKFKLDIGAHYFKYKGFDYLVEAKLDLEVGWKVLTPGTTRRACEYLAQHHRTPDEVAEAGSGAVDAAHTGARSWIDRYLETHRKLQKAFDYIRTVYREYPEE